MKSKLFWDWYENHAVPKIIGDKTFYDRSTTFRKMFEYLDRFDRPVIVETGCIEQPDNWVGNGNSTVLFDTYASFNDGEVYSVDIVPEKVELARNSVSKHTRVSCSDSVEFLKKLRVTPNLLYLDATHLYWHHQTPAQVHHYNELMAIMPRLKADSLVVVDDSPTSISIEGIVKLEVVGKGGLIAKYASEVGAELLFSEYQTGWVGFPGHAENSEWNADQILQKARSHLEQNRWNEAYPLYRAVYSRMLEPLNGIKRVMLGEACAFFARLALQGQDKRFGTAYDWYQKALHVDPRATDYRIELVNKVLRPMGLYDVGRQQAKQAVACSPEDHYAWRTLALMEGARGNMTECLAAHDKQLELSGRSTIALLDKVATLIDLERYEEADPLCDEVLGRPDTSKLRADALHCKAMIIARQGNHEDAIEFYKEALSNGCTMPAQAHFHLSLSLFSIGRYKEGFEYQAKRDKNVTDWTLYTPMRRFERPIFKDQPAPAIVHVHAESGSGDNFAMWRFFPELIQRGYTVRYEARQEFYKLAKDSLENVEVVPMAFDYPGAGGIHHFDYHLPIGEFPYVFGMDIDTIPWNGPYIKADPELVKKYEHWKGKIGIAWSSGVVGEGRSWLRRYGELKSLSFDLIRPIVVTDPNSFVSLQVGPPRLQNDFIADVLPSGDPTWAETAALIDNLDLVITPDTGLAHLAGAMGKPTWVMMHSHNMGWHFLSERPGAPWNERSPWYPSVRLFRQKGESWRPVVDAIKVKMPRY